jgi:anti-sigma B factor antagonist
VPALIVRVRTGPVPTLVTVVGEIDMWTAPQLRVRVGAVPDGDVVLYISGVRLLAAAGLSVLLDLQDRRARAGAQVVLAAPPPLVQKVLYLTGLDETLPMVATIDEAVAFVTGARAPARSADLREVAKRQCAAFPLARRRLPRLRGQHEGNAS